LTGNNLPYEPISLARLKMRGSEQLLGSGQKGDTHGTLVVASSGCGKTELLKRLLLKFWHSFNNISLDSPSLGPSVEFAPEDDDWLLLKRIARDKKKHPLLPARRGESGGDFTATHQRGTVQEYVQPRVLVLPPESH
jgi:hypothetical protein